jgi:hypothetical protein
VREGEGDGDGDGDGGTSFTTVSASSPVIAPETPRCVREATCRVTKREDDNCLLVFFFLCRVVQWACSTRAITTRPFNMTFQLINGSIYVILI